MSNADKTSQKSKFATKLGYILMPLLLCVIGVVFIVLPEDAITVMMRVLGAAMVITGIVKLLGFFTSDKAKGAFAFESVIGAALIVLGLVIAINPENVMSFIFIIIGIAMLIDSLAKIATVVKAKKAGLKSWLPTLLLAVLSGAIAVVLILHPWESTKVMAVVLGISLLFTGLLNLFSAHGLFAIEKIASKEAVEAEFTEKNGDE